MYLIKCSSKCLMLKFNNVIVHFLWTCSMPVPKFQMVRQRNNQIRYGETLIVNVLSTGIRAGPCDHFRNNYKRMIGSRDVRAINNDDTNNTSDFLIFGHGKDVLRKCLYLKRKHTTIDTRRMIDEYRLILFSCEICR